MAVTEHACEQRTVRIYEDKDTFYGTSYHKGIETKRNLLIDKIDEILESEWCRITSLKNFE